MSGSLARDEPQSVAASVAYGLSPQAAAEIAGFALRTRAPAALEIMARSATEGSRGIDDLIAAGGRAADAVSDDDLPWFRHLARVVAWLPNFDSDTAVEWFDAALQRPLAGFEEVNADTAAQLMLRHGQFGKLADILARLPVSPSVAWGVGTDRLNPVLAHGADEQAWLHAFNSPLTTAGVEGVTLSGSGPSRFDQLDLAAPPVSESGDLVTVIVPAYRPDQGLITAVRSILRQTWQELEVLVVDDASPSEYQEMFDAVISMDPRVRVIHQPRNRGTYPARNLGLTQARGTFVTFQDADDWSHPRRLEHQLRPLLSDRRVLASRSDAVRAYPDLTVTYVGYSPTRSNASSLLFRREEVLARLGRFDDIRKSADMEFPRRLETLMPGSVVDLDGPPLAITQLSHGSLSRSDAVPGWTRWNRMAYTHSYRYWHGAIRKGRAGAWLGPDSRRPFPVPDVSFAPEPIAEETPEYDVVVLGDWRPGLEQNEAWVWNIRTFARLGLRVAVIQVETPRNLGARRQPLRTAVQELINEGSISLVHLSQAVRTTGLVVADPETLHFWPETEIGIDPKSVVITASGEVPDALAAHRQAARAFGHDARWVADRAHVRDALLRVGAEVGAQETAVAAAPRVFYSRTSGVPGRPRLGAVVVRPHEEAAALAVAMPDSDDVDVRIWADRRGLRRASNRRFAPNWIVYGADDVTEAEYFGQIDVLLHPWSASDPVAERVILTAQAAGCPVVLHPELRDCYGDTAIYATPEEMATTAMDLLHDTRRRDELLGRSTAFVRTRQGAYRAFWSRLLPGLEWPNEGTNQSEGSL